MSSSDIGTLPDRLGRLAAQLESLRHEWPDDDDLSQVASISTIRASADAPRQRENFEDDPETASQAMLRELSADLDLLGDHLAVAATMINRAQSKARRAVKLAKSEPAQVTWAAVCEHMYGDGLDRLRGEEILDRETQRALKREAWRIVCRMREQMNAEQIAKFLDGLLWEPYNPERHGSLAAVRHRASGLRGHIVSPDDPFFRREGSHINFDGERQDSSVLLLKHGGKVRTSAGQVTAGMKVAPEGQRRGVLVSDVRVDGDEVHITFVDDRELRLPAATRLMAIAADQARWLAPDELEGATQRFKLLEQGRRGDLTALVDEHLASLAAQPDTIAPCA